MFLIKGLIFLLLITPMLCRGQIKEFGPISKFGYVINTSAEESAPKYRMDTDGFELYFVRTFDVNNTGGEFDQDIWVSKQNQEGVWSMAKNMDYVNNLNNNTIGSVFDDEMFVLFSEKRNKRFSIGTAEKINKEIDPQSKWSKPRALPLDLELPNGEIDFCVTSDKKQIIISAQLNNSLGETDLYLFDIETKELENLGAQLNSHGAEIAPFLSAGDDTLFFSSNGLGGEGDFDIFYSVKGQNMSDWSRPINLGNEINSSGFDAYFISMGNLAIWSSNKEGENSDLYYAEIISPLPLSLKLIEKKISVFEGNDGELEAVVSGGTPPYRYSWNTGSFTSKIARLPAGKFNLTVTDLKGNEVKADWTLLSPDPKNDEVLRFPEIQFESGSWAIVNNQQVNSIDSIKAIAEVLKKYPNLQIELWSHTDFRGNNKNNDKLSLNRSRAVFTLLVKKFGINEQRIIPVGKGESTPAFYYDSTSNITVELTEENIEKLSKGDEKVYNELNQKNRRTEGKIVDVNFTPKTNFITNENYYINLNE